MKRSREEPPHRVSLGRVVALGFVLLFAPPRDEIHSQQFAQKSRAEGLTPGVRTTQPRISEAYIEVRSQIAGKRPAQSPETTQRKVGHSIRYTEFDRIARSLPSLKTAIPIREIPVQLHRGDRAFGGRVVCTTHDFGEFFRPRLERGRFLMRIDDVKQRNSLILSREAARALFPNEDPIGQSIKIGPDSFIVLGVTHDSGLDARQGVSDRAAYIPLEISRAQLGEQILDAGPDGSQMVQLSRMIFILREGASSSDAAANIRSALKPFHPRGDVEVVVVGSVTAPR
jgi:putative ABC transport system permease protein